MNNLTTPRAFQRLLTTDAGWGPLALRIPIGIIFAAHGAQKLFGAFGGYGLEGTGQFMASLGLTPGYRWPCWPAVPSSSAAWRCCSGCWCGPPLRR